MWWHTVTNGRGSEGETGEWSGYPVLFTLPRNMVYSALLPLMRTPRLPVVDWTDVPAHLNGLVRFTERRNTVSTRVPSYFKRCLASYNLGKSCKGDGKWNFGITRQRKVDEHLGPMLCWDSGIMKEFWKRWERWVSAKNLKIIFVRGYTVSMQCVVQFGHQLNICSETQENRGKYWSSWPVARPTGCALTYPFWICFR